MVKNWLCFSQLVCLLVLSGCGAGGRPAAEPVDITHTTGSVTLKGEAWADNWFAVYAGEQLLLEDSVPITTERSFNQETFTFKADYPLVLNFVLKDFKENDTGLEYIGESNQQMGDGGFIAQFTDASTGKVVAVTDENMRCMVIHTAPLDKSCETESNPIAGQGACAFTAVEEPAGWKPTSFDDSAWEPATVYSSGQVSPKEGYDEISWNSAAQLIWTSDLETHNTILCRLVIEQTP